MKQTFYIFFLSLIFLTVSSFSSFSGRKVHHKKQNAENFTLTSLSGKKIELNDYQGKIVVLNFWASWSAPCLREMPSLEKLHQKYKHQGIQVLGVAVVSESSDILEKVEMSGVTYPILKGNKNLIKAYGSFSDLPTTFIIDEKGRILSQFSGSNEFKTFEKEINPHLSDPSLTNR